MDYFNKKEKIRRKIQKLRKSVSHMKHPSKREGLTLEKCGECGSLSYDVDLNEKLRVCPKCGFHMKIPAMNRLSYLMEDFSIIEFEDGKPDPLSFPGYEKKRRLSQEATGLNEALIVARGKIGGNETYVFVMESDFMMGSMGLEVGERIAACFDRAREDRLPVIGFCASGGARMQEGIFSLMQMANTSFSLREHGDEGNLFVSFLTDPTTGGVLASFASLGDIILAEPRARIGFTGRRVIEQTIREKLPESFQRAEFQLEHGFIDQIVCREDQRDYLARVLTYHRRQHED